MNLHRMDIFVNISSKFLFQENTRNTIDKIYELSESLSLSDSESSAPSATFNSIAYS